MGVPTYGAIILDETLDNVSMLQPELAKIPFSAIKKIVIVKA